MDTDVSNEMILLLRCQPILHLDPSSSVSIRGFSHFSQVTGEDMEFVPVFGDGASGDFKALFL